MVTHKESLFVKSSYLTHWKVYWPLPVLMLQLWGLLSVRVLNNFFAWFWYSRILLERWYLLGIMPGYFTFWYSRIFLDKRIKRNHPRLLYLPVRSSS